MYKVVFNIKDYSNLNVYTFDEKVKDIFASGYYKISKTIPITGVRCEEVKWIDTDTNNMVINYGSESHIDYNNKTNNIFINIKDSNIRLLDFIYIMLSMYSKDLARKEKYLIHSSALKYDDDKAIVLTGDANSGKSTLAYNLIENYGMQLISNDHTILTGDEGRCVAVGGTKPLELRNGVVDKYFPKLKSRLDSFDYDKRWSQKTVANDYIDESQICYDDKVHVTDIFQINLGEGTGHFMTTKNLIDQRLYLYEQLSREIKGTYNLITGFDYPMPSVEDDKILYDLNRNVSEYIGETEVHMGKGNLEELSDAMVKKLER